MEPTARHQILHKGLGLRGVFAIATGTTISAGFFLLPSFAAQQAGPAVIAAYVIAGILLIPAMLSIVELATAMPRSGGSYYFLDRALGPLAGTIGGIGTWLALLLKTAFALVGMGAYLALLLPGDTPSWVYRAFAVGLAVLFGLLNLGGSKKSGSFQVALVFGLLALLSVFIAGGLPNIEAAHFEGFFDEGSAELASTVGLVFISYIGVTKVASVAEEVQDPETNLPRGVFVGLGTATLVYALGLTVMVGVVGATRLAADPGRGGLPDLTPVATAGEAIGGLYGYGFAGMLVLSIAALFAFSSVANAGILSASRYPLAMSRDNLLPRVFGHVSSRGVPTTGVLLTVAAIVIMVFVEPTKIAKVASAFQLLMFGLLCLSVIVMRESKIESYDPGFRSPWYPWLQIIGIVTPMYLIVQMGWLPTLMTAGLIILCLVWFFWYAADRVDRHGAIYHVFERLGRQRFAGLDTELREILKEKGLRDEDPYDEVIALARILNVPPGASFEAMVAVASEHLSSEEIPDQSPELIASGFLEGTRLGATPVTSGVALPHLRIAKIDFPRMVIARSVEGVMVGGADAFGEPREREQVHAIFFLLSAKGDPAQHLRMLAKIAGRVEAEGFMDRWLRARSSKEIKEILFQEDHFSTLDLVKHGPTAGLIGKSIADLGLPETCLVVIIRRDGEYVVPRAATELVWGDSMTIIGDPERIGELKAKYGRASPSRPPGGRSGSFPTMGS